jgi:DNA-binding transcriptional MerR regulator
MHTIGRLAKRFKLSRSTLLYYDRIGLLTPSGRTGANYRMYAMEDVQRLEQICLYRQTGLSLLEIKYILDGSEHNTMTDKTMGVLEKRLKALDREIRLLRDQQRVVVDILRCGYLKEVRMMNKEKWTTLLRAAGLDDRAMHKWHMEFERLFPDDHREFLESLGISEEEIGVIRAWSKPAGDAHPSPNGPST